MTLRVGIGGPVGSGKTAVALNALREDLGPGDVTSQVYGLRRSPDHGKGMGRPLTADGSLVTRATSRLTAR